MRLPKITVAFDEEEALAFGKISPTLVLGFGIHFTWMFLVQFSAAHLFFEGAAEGTSFVSHVFSLCVFILTFFAYVAFLPQARRIFDTPAHRDRNRLIAAIATCAGGLLLFACSVGSPLGWACIVAAGLLTGVGSAVLLMSYGVSFSMLDTPTIAMGTAFSIVVASVLYLTLSALGVVSPLMTALLAALLPALEYFCLRSCSRQLVDQLSFANCTFPVRKVFFGLHIFAPSFFIGFAIANIRRYALTSTWLPNMEAMGTLAIVVGCLATGLLILLVAITQHSTLNYMFRTLLPISSVFMAIALFEGPDAGAINIGLLFTGYLLMEGACWMFYSDISQRYRISAFQTFGVGRGALALGTLVCTLTMPVVNASPHADLEATHGVVIMLVALCIGFAMLPTNKELLKSLKRGAHCPALAFDEDFLVVPAMIPEDPEKAKKLFPAEGYQPQQPEPFPSAPAPHPEALQGTSPSQLEPDTATHQGRFRRQCEMVADRYLLSRREAEVLFLLAKGRNAAFIQEKLFISEGTARTHMRHIYAKLNVHSQKELMDLVDSEAPE